MTLEQIWQEILNHEGEEFITVKGLRFTYRVVSDHEIVPIRDGQERWKLSKSVFEKALEFPSFSGKEFNSKIIGASYVRGLLEDRRINH